MRSLERKEYSSIVVVVVDREGELGIEKMDSDTVGEAAVVGVCRRKSPVTFSFLVLRLLAMNEARLHY